MKQAYEKAKAHVVLFDNSDVITTSGGDYGENAGEGSCPGNGNWEKYHRPCPGNGNDVGYHCPHSNSNSKK